MTHQERQSVLSSVDGNIMNMPDTGYVRDRMKVDEEYNFKQCKGCEKNIHADSDYCEECWKERHPKNESEMNLETALETIRSFNTMIRSRA